jgi:hypothetical protein
MNPSLRKKEETFGKNSGTKALTLEEILKEDTENLEINVLSIYSKAEVIRIVLALVEKIKEMRGEKIV